MAGLAGLGQVLQEVGTDFIALAGVPAQLQNITQLLQQQQQTLQQQQQTLQQIQADLKQTRTEACARQWTTARAFNGAAGQLHPLMALDFPPGVPELLPPFPSTSTAVDALSDSEVTALLAAYAQPAPAEVQARHNALKVFIGVA